MTRVKSLGIWLGLSWLWGCMWGACNIKTQEEQLEKKRTDAEVRWLIDDEFRLLKQLQLFYQPDSILDYPFSFAVANTREDYGSAARTVYNFLSDSLAVIHDLIQQPHEIEVLKTYREPFSEFRRVHADIRIDQDTLTIKLLKNGHPYSPTEIDLSTDLLWGLYAREPAVRERITRLLLQKEIIRDVSYIRKIQREKKKYFHIHFPVDPILWLRRAWQTYRNWEIPLTLCRNHEGKLVTNYHDPMEVRGGIYSDCEFDISGRTHFWVDKPRYTGVLAWLGDTSLSTLRGLYAHGYERSQLLMHFVKSDTSEAYPLFKELAESGDFYAAIMLAQRGWDVSLGLKLIKEAMYKHQSLRAASYLYFYHDDQEGLGFIRQLAEAEQADACNTLGCIYLSRGYKGRAYYKGRQPKSEADSVLQFHTCRQVRRKPTYLSDEGLDWLKKAANLGSSQAMVNLAVLYFRGFEPLVPRSLEKYQALVDKAKALGNKEATYLEESKKQYEAYQKSSKY